MSTVDLIAGSLPSGWATRPQPRSVTLRLRAPCGCPMAITGWTEGGVSTVELRDEEGRTSSFDTCEPTPEARAAVAVRLIADWRCEVHRQPVDPTPIAV